MPSHYKKQETKKQQSVKTEFIKLEFNEKVYNISIEKLYYVIRKLKDDNTIKYKDYKTTIKYLEELNLFDEVFLDNINRI